MRVFGVSFLLANLDIKILQNNTFTWIYIWFQLDKNPLYKVCDKMAYL